VNPIGVIRTPFLDRASAPRQPAAAAGVRGVIELYAEGNYEDGLVDLHRFDYVWVLFWFHLNTTWKPKVLPPRSTERRGVFATRSPYRPNPIGLSVLRLTSVEGRFIHVTDVDILDGTPVLDLKPYVPYTDSIPGANHGWLEDEGAPFPIRDASAADGDGALSGDGAARAPGARPLDPPRAYDVRFDDRAEAQLSYLEARGQPLRDGIVQVLVLGPRPHAYRRIKRDADGFVLAVRDWRVHFTVNGGTITVSRLFSGYRPSELFTSAKPGLDLHREYTAKYGLDGAG
jgi:tRNA-Thr(GGU) m(6)t(6)A37 methyltransferase TsaA